MSLIIVSIPAYVHAKSLQLCLTLCDAMDCSLPGSSVHGILQARILGGLPCPPPGDLPNPGIEHMSLVSPALAGGFFTTAPPVHSCRSLKYGHTSTPIGNSCSFKFWVPAANPRAAQTPLWDSPHSVSPGPSYQNELHPVKMGCWRPCPSPGQ